MSVPDDVRYSNVVGFNDVVADVWVDNDMRSYHVVANYVDLVTTAVTAMTSASKSAYRV